MPYLYVQGWVAPSSSDSGSTGSLIFDYYWGMVLYITLNYTGIPFHCSCRQSADEAAIYAWVSRCFYSKISAVYIYRILHNLANMLRYLLYLYCLIIKSACLWPEDVPFHSKICIKARTCRHGAVPAPGEAL